MESKLVATPLLREIRERTIGDQKTAAEALSLVLDINMSYSKYQKIEQGDYPVSLTEAIKISKILDVSVKDLWVNQNQEKDA